MANSVRPRLREPGLIPFTPGVERYRARGSGACVAVLDAGDRIELTDREGYQRCELTVLSPGGPKTLRRSASVPMGRPKD